jgi:Tfp pilus assembly protein PilX
LKNGGQWREGFTLVVTISLLVLLTLVAVGFLSLSSVSLRRSSIESANAEARANARMAMMIALGELQKNLGRDQTISAPAGLLDQDPNIAARRARRSPEL